MAGWQLTLKLLVASILAAAMLAVVLFVTYLQLSNSSGLDSAGDYFVFGICLGLLGYALTVIIGVSPWADIGVVSRLLGRPTGKE